MPRIYTGDNDPLDFCRGHFPSEIAASRRYGDGEGPDGRGNCYDYDADHPPYAGEGYKCDHKGCRKVLTEKDD